MTELADTSAWVWSRRPSSELRHDFDTALVDGELATCDMVRLELLYSARNADEFAEMRTELEAVPHCPIGTPSRSGASSSRVRPSMPRAPDAAAARRDDRALLRAVRASVGPSPGRRSGRGDGDEPAVAALEHLASEGCRRTARAARGRATRP